MHAFKSSFLGMCRQPDLQLADSSQIVVGYDDNVIPVEGTTINFSCSPGLVLNGSSIATCTENGEWEPDPSGVECNGLSH